MNSKKWLHVGIAIFVSVSCRAQSTPLSLTFNQLFDRINASKADTVVFEHIRVEPSLSELNAYAKAVGIFWDSLFLSSYEHRFDLFPAREIDKVLLFRNVYFSNAFFVKTTFREHVEFSNCAAPELAFSFCQFDKGVSVTNMRKVRAAETTIQSFDNSTYFDNCEVKGITELRKNELRATLISSSFNEMALDVYYTHVVGCRFTKTFDEPRHTLIYIGPGPHTAEASSHEYLAFWNCKFEDPTGNATFWLQSQFDYLTFSGCEFNLGVVLGFNWINKMFWLERNHFKKFIDIGNLSLPMDYCNLQEWKSIEGKATVGGEDIGLPHMYFPYYPDSDQRLEQVYYNRYLAMLSKFMAIYKMRGDINSYNGCFIHKKQVEERKLDLFHRTNPTLRSWLDLKLSHFLRVFSSYGTDYTSSILFSIYVIFSFALIFFLFPSEEDNLTRSRFVQFFNQSIEYFRTDKQLTQFFQEKRENEISQLEEFQNNLRASRASIPGILSWLGKPFYKISIGINELQLWVLKRTDLVKGKWTELSGKRKFWIGTLVAVYTIAYVVSGFFMRAINALALSLNSFVTLGYGEITAKGIARYLAVAEGIIGWFLLALFSASLVSQLLQQ